MFSIITWKKYWNNSVIINFNRWPLGYPNCKSTYTLAQDLKTMLKSNLPTLHYIFKEHEWGFQYIMLQFHAWVFWIFWHTDRTGNKLLLPILSLFTGIESKRHLILCVKLKDWNSLLSVSFSNHFLQEWHTASSQLNSKPCWAAHTTNYLECSPCFVVAKVPLLWISQFNLEPHLTLNRKFPGNLKL